MIFGIDYLGGAKFGDVILKTHPRGWAAGFFAETFGDAFPVVQKLLKTGRCPRVRIQLLWSDTHSFGDKDIPKIKQLSERYERLAVKFPDVDVELSFGCENNLGNPDKYCEIVAKAAPHCIPVNSVWRGALSKKFKNEVHGTTAKVPGGAYNFSWDGQSAYDFDVEASKAKHAGAEVYFLWGCRMNGKAQDDDKTPRPQRKEWPDADYIRSLIYLAEPKGPTNLPKNWLYKTHSEKEYRPVMIAPVKTDSILLKSGGKTVDTLRYYGGYVDGRSRYYSSKWGFKLGKQYGLCDVFVNGKKVGQVNPGFRDGQFR